MGTAQVKINIVTRRVLLHSDGTRTVITPPRRHVKWIAAAMVVVGLAQAAYGIWADRSDAAAAFLYRRSPSCSINAADSAVGTLNATCRIESAVVYDRHTHSSRSRTNYYLLTVSPSGTRDVTPLFGPGSRELWSRVRPTEVIHLQRFIAPGYHRTGDVMAYGDSVAWSLTRYHPDARTRYAALTAFLGVLLFATGAGVLVSWFRGAQSR